MYFDEISSNRWKLEDAITKYKAYYGDEHVAKMKAIKHLQKMNDNPNIYKAAKVVCAKFLKNKILHYDDNSMQKTDKTRKLEHPNIPGQSTKVKQNYGTMNSIGVVSAEHATFGETTHVGKKRKSNESEEPAETFSSLSPSEGSSYAPVFLKLQEGVKLIRSRSKWIIGDCNITFKFQDYQEACFEYADAHGFILETNAYEVLALSSLLLIKPHQHSEMLLDYFSSSELNDIRFNILSNAANVPDFEKIGIDAEVEKGLRVIVKNLNKSSGNRDAAIKELMELMDGKDKDERMIIKTFMQMVDKLPSVEINEPFGEIELNVSYVDPAFTSLFTDFDSNSKTIWPNLTQRESKIRDSGVNKSRRPDAVMRYLKQRKYGESRGYGEIKTIERRDDNYELTRDLIRGFIFSKESIDINEMKGNLYFQVVGAHATFYYTTLIEEGIYAAVEICDFNIPLSLKELSSYLAHLDELVLIRKVYDHSCVRSESPIRVENKRPTLDSPSFRAYIDKGKSKFTQCDIRF